MKPLEMSPWQAFKEKWRHGCGSRLCELANRVCLARGSVPCDLLLIGEAPGESEDSCGTVFKGPAGHLLDDIVRVSVPNTVTKGFTNLVGCLPHEDNDDPKKSGKPRDEEIEQCSERLREFIILCNPKLIICVGTLAKTWLDKKYLRGHQLYWRHINRVLNRDIPTEDIAHPAWILRQNQAMQPQYKRKSIITIRKAVNKYILGIEDNDDD